jgi:hypothetical protein
MLNQFKRRLRISSRRTVWPTAVGGAALLLFVAAGATQLLRAGETRAVDEQGSIYQSGRLVGWAVGATFSRQEPEALEFEQISNAAKFARDAEFQYGGYLLRILRVRQVEFVPSGPARTDTRLLKVVAKIQ